VLSNYPQGHRIPTKHPGHKPAGRVIDFRQEKKTTPIPLETVSITCGLCRFQFDRVTQPALLVLVCPSCGVRFEHHLPEPAPQPPKNPRELLFSTPPKRQEATLHQPLFHNPLQAVPAEFPATDPSVIPFVDVDTVELSETEEESLHQESPIFPVFAPISSGDESVFDKVQQTWSQEIQQETQWIANLITIAQSILIAAALVGLVSGISSYFREETQSVAKAPREKNDDAQTMSPRNSIQSVAFRETESHSPTTEKNNVTVITETTNTKPQSHLQQMITVSRESQQPQHSIDPGQNVLPLFDINDLPPLLPTQQKSAQAENVQKPPTLENKERLASSLPLPVLQSATAGEEFKAEATKKITEQKAQLQAKLAETEKKVQTLEQRYLQSLQEQEQIQTQTKKLVGETLLQEAAITLERDPTRSLFLSLKSIQTLQELGLQVSERGKTVFAKAYATQTAGERLFEQLPNTEALSVSSDGRWLLTFHADRSLWIRDISKSEKDFQIDVSPIPVVDLDLSPDEHWLVGARADGMIEMWDMTAVRPSEAKIVLHEQIPGLHQVQISPDGRWLVAYGRPAANGQQEQTLHPVGWNGVWVCDMNTFTQGNIPRAMVLRGHEGPIRCLALSSDGRWLATGSEDRSVRVFDLKSTYPGGNQKVLLGHQLEITDLQFAPGGQWIATGSRDNTVRIWDLQSETANPTARILRGHNGWISSLAISADGKWLATAGYDQLVRLWNAQSILSRATDNESLMLFPEQGKIHKIAFTPDSGSLITCGDRSLKIWDLTTESSPEHTVEISRNVSFFSFGENGRWLVLHSNPTGKQGGYSTVSLWPLKFEDMVRQATRFQKALPTDLRQREDAYVQQFEQRIFR